VAAGCSTSTPERAVREFVSARIAGDEERAAGFTVEEDLTGFMGGEPFLSGSGLTFDLSPAEVDVDRAVVTAHYGWDDEVVDIPYACRRIGTKWKVALRDTEAMWLEQPH
jgi:hypothetical protein